MKACLLIFFLVPGITARAQLTSNFRSVIVHWEKDTLVLDSLSLVPSTFFLFREDGQLVPDSLYRVNYARSIISGDPSLHGSSYRANYRVLPSNLSFPYYQKDPSLIFDYAPGSRKSRYYTVERNELGELFGGNELSKRGAISRGITMGNNQDVIVNSSLNLQLSGKISDDIQVLAAITDNNIPLQPDGYTRQIQEFDKVFIRVFNEHTSLTAGDFEIGSPNGYFMQYYRKLQGAMINHQVINARDSARWLFSASGAIAKGKYNRARFNGIEGVQGPYRLYGASNEAFIIILSGTEKVYIDGRMLERGFDRDYIIDYNTAEIIFTTKQLITKDKRIVVEYEYSDRNYVRSLVQASGSYKYKKGSAFINVYSEQDNKNQPVQQDLKVQDKEFLAQLGDAIDQAFVPNIDTMSFNPNAVLYARVDTTWENQVYTIYLHSPGPATNLYRVGFTNMGPRKGNYVLSRSSANGRVFQWVAPVNGIPSGDHEPIVLLIAPSKSQMISLGAQHEFTRSTGASTEIAISHKDLNTFSPLDASDNTGLALLVSGYQRLSRPGQSNLTLRTNYQFVHENFKEIDRFRSAEFERDWNLNNPLARGMENKANLQLEYASKKGHALVTSSDWLSIGEHYKATRNSLGWAGRPGKWLLDFDGSYLLAAYPASNSRFLRQKASIARPVHGIVLGIREETEHNSWRADTTTNLLAGSFAFRAAEFFAEKKDYANAGWFTSYKYRQDYLPLKEELRYVSLGQDVTAGLNLTRGRNTRFATQVTYRRLEYKDSVLLAGKPEDNLLARVEYQLRLFRNAIGSNTGYEVGSGLEGKKEFAYVEVARGQGVFTWTDYNGNGVKELNEFEVAAFPDQANYIRVFTPTTEYIKTYQNQFSQTLHLTPARAWQDTSGWKHYVARFSHQLAYRVNRKTTRNDLLEQLNPLPLSIDDPGLAFLATNTRNNLNYTHPGSRVILDFTTQLNQNKLLLANGFDTRSNQLWSPRFQFILITGLNLGGQYTRGTKSYQSEFFPARDHQTQYHQNEANLAYQFGLNSLVNLGWKHDQKSNLLGGERSRGNTLSLDIILGTSGESSLNLGLKYLNLSYNAEPNTPLAYEMLEGLFPGNNGTWTLQYQKTLVSGLELSVQYQGRASAKIPVVHTGSMQLRAVF